VEERLKEEVELKLGKKIMNRGDCQLLSDLIFEQQKKQISYNTLRRFFKVDKNANQKPSSQTLNVLSKFVGHANYFSFTSGEPSKASWELQNDLFYYLDQLDTAKLQNFLIACRIQKAPNLIEILTVCFRELLLSKNYKAVHDISQSKGLNLFGLSYSERVQFGRSVGLVMRKIKIPKKELIALAENNVFLEMVFLIFVDYSSLNVTHSNYIRLMEYVSVGAVMLKRKDQLFFECLSYLRKLLIGEPLPNLTIRPSNNLHPILYSRVCSVLIIENSFSKNSNASILEGIAKKMQSRAVNKMDYIFELITTALLLRDFELMSFVVNSEAYAEGKLYQEAHLQQLIVVKTMLHIKSGAPIKAKKNLLHINKKGWGRSYFDIYELFLSVINYEMEPDSIIKNKIMNDYMKKVKQLNYNLFNKNYLLEYFK
jgi:hypothetical protein